MSPEFEALLAEAKADVAACDTLDELASVRRKWEARVRQIFKALYGKD